MTKLLLSVSLLFLTVIGVSYANASTPEVDVQTGLVTNGPLVVNQQFVWVNRSSVACSVSTGSGQQWFSPDPLTVSAASGGNTGTATATATTAGNFTYTSPCLEVGQPSVGIHGGH